MRLRIDTMIERDRDTVWRAFDDPDNLKRWQPTLRSYEPRSGERGQPGATAELTYDENGREITMIETIREREPPERFAATYETAMAVNAMDNRFIAAGEDSTRWLMDCDFRFRGMLWRAMGLFMKRAVAKRIQADAARFRSMVEERAAAQP